MKDILEKFKNGEISLEKAEKLIAENQVLELNDYIKIDNYRESRTGFPEAVYAEGKTDEDIIEIINNCPENKKIIITRFEKERYENIKKRVNKNNSFMNFYSKAKILVIGREKINNIGKIGIISAGTSDINIAEESRIIATEIGCEVIYSYDIGVAGIHRLFKQIKKIINEDVKVLIVIAGMEGALPSVVAGLVDIPVIGVPTSVGYGVGEKGFTALHAMLQSCAPGIAVVNIDNGFGAATFAAKILKKMK